MGSLSDDEAHETCSMTYPALFCMNSGKVLVLPLQDNRGGRLWQPRPTRRRFTVQLPKMIGMYDHDH